MNFTYSPNTPTKRQKQSSSPNTAEIESSLKLQAEDSELKARQKQAYRRSLARETEVARIESERELDMFLTLWKSDVRKTGYLPDTEWQARARDAYKSDRNFTLNQNAIAQRTKLEQAVLKLEEGTNKMQDAISLYLSQAKPLENDLATELQTGCVLLIRGSHVLLSLAEQYLYFKQNRLRKALAKKLPMLNYPQFRREERIKHIRYILDYLQFAVAASDRANNLQVKRVQGYLRVLPLEVTYLAEWLGEEIDKQGTKGNLKNKSQSSKRSL